MIMKPLKDRPQFSRNLVRLRKERRLTQEDLATKTGLSKRVIAYYETEAVKPPIDNVEALAKALCVEISELLGTRAPTATQSEFENLNGHTLKQLKKILSLSPGDRHYVYTFVDSLLAKRKKSGR